MAHYGGQAARYTMDIFCCNEPASENVYEKLRGAALWPKRTQYPKDRRRQPFGPRLRSNGNYLLKQQGTKQDILMDTASDGRQ